MKIYTFEDVPLAVKLLTAGTAACFADAVTFPLDMVKVRLQVQGEGKTVRTAKTAHHYRGVWNTLRTIAKEEGPKSLYNGLSAGLQRQMCFASIRLGLYEPVKSFYMEMIEAGPDDENKSLVVLAGISAGMTTGALAVVLAQPTDVVKVRFQARRGKEERYKSNLEAYKAILKDEGVRGLWKGTFPNVMRNCIVNVAEIVCYDFVKEAILKSELLNDNIFCHFSSALVAGFCTTIVASPIDVIKTRYMNSPANYYKSAIDCAIQTIKKEGAAALYKGFVPSFSRLVSWNIVLWITYEKLKFLASSTYWDSS